MLKEKEIYALIALLDDNDLEVLNHVKNQLIAQGTAIIEYLQEGLIESESEIEIENIQSVIDNIQDKDLKKDFKRWLLTKDKSLLEGAFYLSKISFFDYDFEKYNASLNKLKKDIWLELNQHQTPFEHVSIINQILYFQNKFKVDEHVLDLDLYSLPYILEHHKGNIYSIGILYAIIAEMMHIPIYTVDLADHLILAYCRDFKENKELLQEDVLFYINPEKNGAVFSKNEIDAYLTKKNLTESPEYYQPATNVQIIKSLLSIFANIVVKNDIRKLKLIEELLELMDND